VGTGEAAAARGRWGRWDAEGGKGGRAVCGTVVSLFDPDQLEREYPDSEGRVDEDSADRGLE